MHVVNINKRHPYPHTKAGFGQRAIRSEFGSRYGVLRAWLLKRVKRVKRPRPVCLLYVFVVTALNILPYSRGHR